VVLIKGDKVDERKINLQPYAVLTGRLLDPDGAPLAGRPVGGHLDRNQLGLTHGWIDFFLAKTDSNGRFRVAVMAGVRLNGYLSAGSGRGAVVFRKIILKPGEKRDLGDIEVMPRDD
jgi:hypothetical protein